MLKIPHSDREKSLLILELAWQAAFKKTAVKLELLNDIDMLLMNEKGIRRGKFHSINQYIKANNKCMKKYDKNKGRHILKFWV